MFAHQTAVIAVISGSAGGFIEICAGDWMCLDPLGSFKENEDFLRQLCL